MENVFSYFFAIGSGLALGIASIALPGMWLMKKITGKKQTGGKKNAASY